MKPIFKYKKNDVIIKEEIGSLSCPILVIMDIKTKKTNFVNENSLELTKKFYKEVKCKLK
jgi:hypothetical protein